MKFPKISIVTPNFNQASFLEYTIKSVLSQGYPNLEYIIIDGKSSDDSVEIIKKYSSKLHYWVSEKDNGMYEAIQKGFEKSSGEIMAWINSDDMYHTNAFFTVAEIFSTFKDVCWLSGANTNFDTKNRTLNTRSSHEHNRYSQFYQPLKHIQQESTFWRRTLWEKAGSCLDTSLKYAGDFDLWARFNRHSQIHLVDALIGGFRMRGGQLSRDFFDKYVEECDKIIAREKSLFGFYDICMLDEATNLHEKVNFSHLSGFDKQKYKNRLHLIANQQAKIVFDFDKERFYKKEKNMSDVLSTINKQRKSMKEHLDMLKFEQKYYPEVVLDVGVAYGTPELYDVFPRSHFVLFEPLEEFWSYIEKSTKDLKKMDLELCALGRKEEACIINVHDDLVGSSLCFESEKNTNGKPREIQVKTLDSFIQKYNLKNKSILLKIDVQGFEKEVLQGSQALLNNVDVLILELSFFEFFDNKVQFYDMVKYLDELGYVIYDMFDFLNRPLDGALAQINASFVKKDSQFRKSHIFANEEQRKKLNSALLNSTESENIDLQSNFDFSKQFNKLSMRLSHLVQNDEKYLVYGAGIVAEYISFKLGKNLVAKVDKKSELISLDICKDEIYSIENIPNMSFDKVIISVLGREKAIIKDLIKKFGIRNEDIIIFDLS